MNKKKAFTLIEVMVAVMIITVVIAALLRLQANNTHIFNKLKEDEASQRYLSLFTQSDYGFEESSLTLDMFIDRFDVDDDLRRELKDIKVKVLYQKVENIDFSDEIYDDTNQTTSGLNFEIGRSIIKLKNGSSSVLRIKLQ